MKRLSVAFVLAVGLHGAAFWTAGRHSHPLLPLARNPSVTIDLVAVQAPAAITPAPAENKVRRQPEPSSRHLQKNQPKAMALSRPVPHPPAPEPSMVLQKLPVPEPPVYHRKPPVALAARQDLALSEREPIAPADPGPVTQKERAAVRESVPLYDLNPPPAYPWVARRRNYQGTVLLDVRVSAKGTVTEVKVAQSSGYPVLDRSALDSVRRWRFEPARRGSRTIETWVQVPVRFELR